jgi:hypothetical protein
MRSPRTASEDHATGMWYGVVLLSQAAELSWLPFARLGGGKGSYDFMGIQSAREHYGVLVFFAYFHRYVQSGKPRVGSYEL